LRMMATLMTVSEVATALRVSPATVRRWLTADDLHGVKVGKAWRIPETEVDRIRNGR
jgi:acetyl-CoA synthetase